MKIHKLWKKFIKIKRFILGTPTEIQFVKASLKKHYNELYDLEDAFDPKTDCCLDCIYGAYYNQLTNKIKRIEHRLQILQNRKIKNKYGKNI